MVEHPTDHVRCVRCHHERDAHEHYRAGTDCGLCDCERFRWGLGGVRVHVGRWVAAVRDRSGGVDHLKGLGQPALR
jgi:hypothetical protein